MEVDVALLVCVMALLSVLDLHCNEIIATTYGKQRIRHRFNLPYILLSSNNVA